MNMKQVFGLAGGFLFVYIVITLTNKPQVPSDSEVSSQFEVVPVGEGPRFTAPDGSGRRDGEPAIGFCLPGMGAETLASAETDTLLDRMAGSGRWVTISPALFQENAYASEVAADPGQTPSEASLARAIARCRDLGLQVVLRPVVVAKDGSRRERFVPGDPAAWFESYTTALSPYIDLAEREQVQVLSLGANYAQLEGTQPWGDLIKEVRQRYKGRLTYGAGLQSESGNGGYQAVPFWGELDYIGIEAPLPGSMPAGASEETADEAWEAVGNGIGSWMEQQQPSRQAIFTSVGFAPNLSAGDAGVAYRSFKRAVGSRPWVAAATWYQWDSRLDQAPKRQSDDMAGGESGRLPALEEPPAEVAPLEP